MAEGLEASAPYPSSPSSASTSLVAETSGSRSATSSLKFSNKITRMRGPQYSLPCCTAESQPQTRDAMGGFLLAFDNGEVFHVHFGEAGNRRSSAPPSSLYSSSPLHMSLSTSMGTGLEDLSLEMSQIGRYYSADQMSWMEGPTQSWIWITGSLADHTLLKVKVFYPPTNTQHLTHTTYRKWAINGPWPK